MKYIPIGDALAFIFKITGIKWLVKKINPDCGCDKRQEALNIKFKRK